MEPVEERREGRQAPLPGDMAPPSFIPSRRREAAGSGETNNPGTNKLPRPPITRQGPNIPAEGLPIAEGMEGRPGGNEEN